MILPENLKFLRKVHEINKKELAKALRTTPKYIDIMESGRYNYNANECTEYVNTIFKVFIEKTIKEIYENKK